MLFWRKKLSIFSVLHEKKNHRDGDQAEYSVYKILCIFKSVLVMSVLSSIFLSLHIYKNLSKLADLEKKKKKKELFTFYFMPLLLSEIPIAKLGKSGYFWPTPGAPAIIYSHIAELLHKLQEMTSKQLLFNPSSPNTCHRKLCLSVKLCKRKRISFHLVFST